MVTSSHYERCQLSHQDHQEKTNPPQPGNDRHQQHPKKVKLETENWRLKTALCEASIAKLLLLNKSVSSG